jgi:hypothetical protein
MSDLALRLELHHGADGILDRHGVVDAMDEIEVDGIGAEPFEALFAGFDHVVRIAFGAGLAIGQANVAELGGEDVLFAAPFQGATDQLLVGAVRSVGVGRVDKVDAEVRRPVQRGDRLLGIGHAVDRCHAHATEADGRHVEGAEFSASDHDCRRGSLSSVQGRVKR